MIKEETGTVISVGKESIVVRVDAAAGCSSCGMCRGSKTSGEISCRSYPGIEKGERVKVRINTTGGFISALFTFFLPAFFLVFFLTAGENISRSAEIMSPASVKLLFLALGIISGGVSMYSGNMFLKKRVKYSPEIISRISGSGISKEK
ncbi:MAG: SoxR reducing system RseC family protein [Candidatus Aureabacteria bacterium]|nr:SoxR reducing system RseC family protein [Candidatus Auribacterota bacterium]